MAKNWMQLTLLAAAAYNLLWGGWIVLYPSAYFKLLDMPIPIYPEIWQCVGMIVGVYGIGYGIASFAPLHHWPIILVGLLGKVLGPIGLAIGIAQGKLPLVFGVVCLTNDFVWWIPFGMILIKARRHALEKNGGFPLDENPKLR